MYVFKQNTSQFNVEKHTVFCEIYFSYFFFQNLFIKLSIIESSFFVIYSVFLFINGLMGNVITL